MLRSRKSHRGVLWGLTVLLGTVALFLSLLLVDTLGFRKAQNTPNHKHFQKSGKHFVSVHPLMVRQRFLADKPAGHFRAFVIGGSAAMGTPYVHQKFDRMGGLFNQLNVPNKGGISTWVGLYLEKVFGPGQAQVLNAAKGTQSLMLSLPLVKEILEIGQADLLIVLSGNNERHFRKKSNFEQRLRSASSQFRNSVGNLTRLAQEHNVPILLLTVPTNIRDWLPGDHLDGLRDPQLTELIEKGDYEKALRLLESHSPLEDSPLRFYIKGKIHDNQERWAQAKAQYERARDRDRDFLRCRSPWNDILRSVNSPFIQIIDMEKILARYAKNGIPGYDLFHDYCHFNLQANKIISYHIARAIQKKHRPQQDLLAMGDADWKKILPRSTRALYILKILKWIRVKYYSMNRDIAGLNSQKVIEHYNRAVKEWDEISRQMDLLRSLSTATGSSSLSSIP